MNEQVLDKKSKELPYTIIFKMQGIINRHMYTHGHFNNPIHAEDRERDKAEFLVALSDYLHDPENERYKKTTVFIQSMNSCISRLLQSIQNEITDRERRLRIVKRFLKGAIKDRLEHLNGRWEEIL